MSEILVPIIVVPSMFLAIFAIIKTVSDNSVRRKVIDKGMVDENVKHLFESSHSEFRPNSLKWGMVLMAIGLAILIGQMAPYSLQSEVTIGGGFILSGLALVLYYVIAGRLQNGK